MTTKNLIDSLIPQIQQMAAGLKGRNIKHWSMVSAKQGTTPTMGSWGFEHRDHASHLCDVYLQDEGLIRRWLVWLFTGCLRTDWKLEGLYRYCALRAGEMGFLGMMEAHQARMADAGLLEEVAKITMDGPRFAGLSLDEPPFKK